MMTDKLLFRKQALKMRSELFPSAEKKKEADLKILENLVNADLIRKAEIVLTYVSYRDEADTLKLYRISFVRRHQYCRSPLQKAGRDGLFHDKKF